MCAWIVQYLGDEVPLHFTAFHPDFKMRDKERTSLTTLQNARDIAKSYGIKYCYLGNVHDLDNHTTYCPKCDIALIKRYWHSIIFNKVESGNCKNCGTKIAGIF
jgi:pyruvate formate lyase activating enzyme